MVMVQSKGGGGIKMTFIKKLFANFYFQNEISGH